MSVVFKCDRCGEIFNRKVPDINDCYGTANSILFLDCTVERNRFGLGEEPIQLCPSCMKELNDWLTPDEQKPDTGNKNEWNSMNVQPQCGEAVEIKFENGSYVLTLQVKNVGKASGKEVVQLYVSAPSNTSLVKPEKELKDFTKTGELKSGESQTVTIGGASVSNLRFGERKCGRCTYRYGSVGHCQPGERSRSGGYPIQTGDFPV